MQGKIQTFPPPYKLSTRWYFSARSFSIPGRDTALYPGRGSPTGQEASSSPILTLNDQRQRKRILQYYRTTLAIPFVLFNYLCNIIRTIQLLLQSHSYYTITFAISFVQYNYLCNPVRTVQLPLQSHSHYTATFAIPLVPYNYLCNPIRTVQLPLQSHSYRTTTFAIAFVLYNYLCNPIRTIQLPVQSHSYYIFTLAIPCLANARVALFRPKNSLHEV